MPWAATFQLEFVLNLEGAWMSVSQSDDLGIMKAWMSVMHDQGGLP